MTIAWLFPGQGSQSVGMGADFIASSPAARAVFDRVDAALGERLSKVILDGPEDTLRLTSNAQPAILAVSCAILAALRERVSSLMPPAVAAGHSLGEYSALVAAEAISLEDAARLVRARGVAMQNAVPPGVGAMSAILGLAPDQIDAICRQARQGEIVTPANYNAPGQVVIAGHAVAVARANDLATAQNGRVRPLNVSAPFHCALMKPAAGDLETRLAEVTVAKPRFPIVSNFDAQPNDDPHRIKDLLVRQVDGAVRWEESVRVMAAMGVTAAVEIGPGKVLAGLVKRIAKEIRLLTICDVASLDRASAFLNEAC